MLSRILAAFSSARTVTVGSVRDGDSFETAPDAHGRIERVRLLSINAPEYHAPGGRAARAALAAMIPPGAVVTLEFGHRARDRYGRTLAYVTSAAGLNVNLEMVRRGFAESDVYSGDGGLFGLQLGLSEAGARLAGRGLWG